MTIVVKESDLLVRRTKAVDRMTELAGGETMTAAQITEFDGLEGEVKSLDDQLSRLRKAQGLAAETAQPVEGQDPPKAPAQAKSAEYPLGSYVKALYHAGGNAMLAGQWAEKNLGESSPVTKALSTSVAASGGALVPEDFANQIIELLRPATVVRASGPVVVPMPRGTMRMGKQTSGVTGTYGAEGAKAPAQKPGTGNIIATFKKLTVLVPVSNDFLRYATPATDGLVQNDIVRGLARTEDLAFIRGDGTADWPKGLRFIAQASNLVPSNATFTLTTVDQELSAAILALENANVPMLNPCWFFHPRIKQFLLTLKNSNGFYVYKDEMTENGTLRGYPFKTTTQIPQNLVDGTQTEIYFTDMSQALLFDALTLALSMSMEGTYTAEDGTQRNAFERDETLFRAIAEHDFHLRHDEATAIITGVKWA